jgi:hypothetical protein
MELNCRNVLRGRPADESSHVITAPHRAPYPVNDANGQMEGVGCVYVHV